MSERVEAESAEAKRFLNALRGLLAVPKAEIDKLVKYNKSKRKKQRGNSKAKSQ